MTTDRRRSKLRSAMLATSGILATPVIALLIALPFMLADLFVPGGAGVLILLLGVVALWVGLYAELRSRR